MDAVEDMKLFGIIEFLDLFMVGRNARWLRTPPCGTVQEAGRHGGLPLRQDVKDGCESQVQGRNTLRALCQALRKDIKERFFATKAQNDRIAGRHGGLALPLLLCLMLLLLVVSPVGAQVPPTRLFFNPTPLEIDTTIDPTGVVTLEVADGVDIFAFDLFVQYDPSLLWVSQVTLGDFLGEGLFCMDQVNEPGLVHYSCTRFGVDYGVTGSGVLLELTFEALGQGGDTVLALGNSEIYDWASGVQPVYPTLEDGAVNVRPYWTFLPLILSASGQGMGALR